jgi:hypothetical protein
MSIRIGNESAAVQMQQIQKQKTQKGQNAPQVQRTRSNQKDAILLKPRSTMDTISRDLNQTMNKVIHINSNARQGLVIDTKI